MITNNSPLPWKKVLSKDKKKYIIYDKNNNIVVDNVRQLGDALYIEDYCNNMHKALHLLERSEIWLKSNKLAQPLCDEILEFLKQLT